jgi:hypothetical protein
MQTNYEICEFLITSSLLDKNDRVYEKTSFLGDTSENPTETASESRYVEVSKNLENDLLSLCEMILKGNLRY